MKNKQRHLVFKLVILDKSFGVTVCRTHDVKKVPQKVALETISILKAHVQTNHDTHLLTSHLSKKKCKISNEVMKTRTSHLFDLKLMLTRRQTLFIPIYNALYNASF